MPRKKSKSPKSVESFTHDDAKRPYIPTSEYQTLMARDEGADLRQVLYERRNRDLDPQLVWRGKDEQDWSDLVVNTPPIYIQEKVHPQALVNDLMRETREKQPKPKGEQIDLFSDFNGIPETADKTEFYQHEQNWSNRMILGDSLQVMASLAEREGLRGKVQCIYFDPPYGIKFNSNFQWSTTSRDVKDGKSEHITREPEQVKAFRDTWRDGIHSYLTYLRDRLTVARDLLTESGSIFVQIGEDNVHRVRTLLDELFGENNYISTISVTKTSGATTNKLASVADYILWYSKRIEELKYRQLLVRKEIGIRGASGYNKVESVTGFRRSATKAELKDSSKISAEFSFFKLSDLRSSRTRGAGDLDSYTFNGKNYSPGKGTFKTNLNGLSKVQRANRLDGKGKTLNYIRYLADFPAYAINNVWTDTGSTLGGDKLYIVQTAVSIVARCIGMATIPGDLVLDPTCGAGTTAYIAEQWGRRWITIDTSRVSLALARARIMGARYPYYLLKDSAEGRKKEAELSQEHYEAKPTFGKLQHGFVYERVPHITLKAIANNAEIDVIYEDWRPKVEGALQALNRALRGHTIPFTPSQGGRKGKPVVFDAPGQSTFTMPSKEVVPAYALMEWEVPREAPEDWPEASSPPLEAFWEARIGRQKEIDASIQAKADYEFLYDKPYEDKKKVRVAGPFTVESLSPHRTVHLDEDEAMVDPQHAGTAQEVANGFGAEASFDQMVLENLKRAGVQQAHKDDRIDFEYLEPWPGTFVSAEGRYREGEELKRAAVFIGPEFGTVTRPDLFEAAREANEGGFDVLVSCAFSYDAQTTELKHLGPVPILKARMNADLHMAEDLKNTGKGNLFVVFGEPDIELRQNDEGLFEVEVKGVDVFHPATGEVRSDGPEGIACWFIDTDYNAESFFVRHAYFLGASDPYKQLRTTLKAEINTEAWETLHSAVSRPFPKPESGRIAVKVINHLGDEVMKVMRV